MMLFWSRNFSLSFHLQVEKAVPAPLREVRAADRAALSLLPACSPPPPPTISVASARWVPITCPEALWKQGQDSRAIKLEAGSPR